MKVPMKQKRQPLNCVRIVVLVAVILSVLAGITKADDGDVLWQKSYNFIDNAVYLAKTVKATDDGGYIIGGDLNWIRLFVAKTDANGDTLWTNTYGWGDQYFYEFGSIEQTSDGGYIIGAHRIFYIGEEDDYGGQVVLIKTDANGDTLWTRYYGRDDYTYLSHNCKTVHETSDRGYIIGGYMTKRPVDQIMYHFDGLVIKTDANGDTLWTRTCGEDIDSVAYVFYNTLETADGDFITGGYRQYINWDDRIAYSEPYLMKLSADGDSLWAKTYSRGWLDSMYDLTIASDGGYVYCGAAGTDVNLMIGKTDSNGNELWYHEYVTESDPELDAVTHEGTNIKETGSGDFLIVGIKNCIEDNLSYKNPIILKTDDLGERIWFNNYINDIGGSGFWSIDFTDDGGFVAAGGTSPEWYSWTDALLVKFDMMVGVNDTPVSLPGEFTLMQNYPNPFNMSTVISYELKNDVAVKLDVYDLLGRKIETLVDENQTAGVHNISWHADDIASGMYFYKLEAGDYTETMTMSLIK